MSSIGIEKQAYALANMLHMGISTEEALARSQIWLEERIAQSTENALNLVPDVSVQDFIEKPANGHVFASFHMSLYPAVYHALAHHNPDKEVFSLLGTQSDEHQRLLTHLAIEIGITVKFIHSGRSMLRDIRDAVTNQRHVIILVDVPWSLGQNKSDYGYDVPFGRLLAFSTLEKLLEKIDPDYRVVSAVGPQRDLRLVQFPKTGIREAFWKFSELLMVNPEQYERLNTLHNFCDFAVKSSSAIAFQKNEKRYVLSCRTMKLFAVSGSDQNRFFVPGVSQSSESLAVGTKVCGGVVDALVSI